MTVRELQDILTRMRPEDEVLVPSGPAGMLRVELRHARIRRMRASMSEGGYRTFWRRAKSAERLGVRTFLVLEG